MSYRRYIFMLCLFGLSVSSMATSSLVHAVIPSVDATGKLFPSLTPVPSLAPMLKQVNPAVVNISTYSIQQSRQNPLLNDPFFRHFFNVPDRERHQRQPNNRRTTKRQQSAGSGVILNAEDGIVMTNYHVIKGADEIQVSLTKRRFGCHLKRRRWDRYD